MFPQKKWKKKWEAKELLEEDNIWKLSRSLAEKYQYDDLSFSSEHYQQVFLKEMESQARSAMNKHDLVLLVFFIGLMFISESFYPSIFFFVTTGLLIFGIFLSRLILKARLNEELFEYQRRGEILERAAVLAK